jgi:hypothetical protein
MNIVDHHPVIEEVLDAWSPSLARARDPYGGHVYRVFNYARRVFGSPSHDDDFAVASVFHDLGIWSDRTFDYLAPSSARAAHYLCARDPAASTELVVDVIENHHSLRRVRGGVAPLAADAFRRADYVDLSRGFLRAGMDRAFVREVIAAFPYRGFHGVLSRTAFAWFLRHPLRPLPMLRLTASHAPTPSAKRADE